MSGEISKKGFTLLELLVVIILIGILSALAYSGLMGVIQTNKAKEAARIMTTFAERTIAEGKMRKDSIAITLSTNKIDAKIGTSAASSELLPNGFTKPTSNIPVPTDCTSSANVNKDVKAKVSIGTSGISGPFCFVACNAGGYCGAAVKLQRENSFKASIRKGASASWEVL